MPKIVFLPHQDLCPDGAVLEANVGEAYALRIGVRAAVVQRLADFTAVGPFQSHTTPG